MRVLAVVNPRAGGGRGAAAAARLQVLARRRGLEITLRHTLGPGDAAALGREAARDWEVLAAVGGDGTVHELANGLLAVPRAQRRAALAVLGVGTGNDLARALGIPAELEGALHTLCTGRRRWIDAVQLDGGWLVNNLSAGFGGEVVRDMARSRWLRPAVGGHLAYLLFALRRLVHPGTEFTVHADARCWHGSFFEVHVANGPFCGGGVSFAPEAQLDDGWLELTLLEPRGLAATVALLLAAQRARPLRGPGIERLRARRVRIEGVAPFAYHADGESRLAQAPAAVRLEVVPGALEVIAP